MVGLMSMTETVLQPVLATAARLLTSSMATPPGAGAVHGPATSGTSSTTGKSTAFEPTPLVSTTSSAKWRGPVRICMVPEPVGGLGSGVETGIVTSTVCYL